MDRNPGHSTAVANETKSSVTRVTNAGKSLRYDLQIIQQPERARACGAGAKASSDRRPVDPPAILRLQVYELTPDGREIDVTTGMNATSFVYAMLEHGRAMAQPRNVEDVNKLEGLTGSTVAGMQAFDRPTPAIYFIFPDLSVRHEGKYRLLFNLYESNGSIEDEDRHISGPPAPPALGHAFPISFTHRMDLRSVPFDVYSAKRFPGLTESTPLSRTFAEQGSRIRIRRDVRLRRRDNKGGKDWDDMDDENSHMHSMSQTPDSYGHAQMGRHSIDSISRPRSASSHTQNNMQAVTRHASLNDLSQHYQQQARQQQNSVSQHTSHPANFGMQPYQPTTTQPYTQASFMHPPAPQYATNAFAQSPVGVTAPQQATSYYGYVQQPALTAQQQLTYPAMTAGAIDPNAYTARNFNDYTNFADGRKTSMQNMIPTSGAQLFAPQTTQAHAAASQYAVQPAQHMNEQQSQVMTTQAQLPETMQPPTRVTTPNPPALNAKSNFGTTLPPLSTSFSHNVAGKLEAGSPSSSTTGAYTTSLPTPTDSNKRSYGTTFPTSWQNMASKQGARPADTLSSNMFLQADAEGDDTIDMSGTLTRFYRRAGGQRVERQIP